MRPCSALEKWLTDAYSEDDRIEGVESLAEEPQESAPESGNEGTTSTTVDDVIMVDSVSAHHL